MKRPAGFTILSLFFGYLTITGLGHGIFQLNKPHGSIMMAVIACIYGLAAYASAIGLWKFRPWAYKAVIAWSAAAILLMLYMQFVLFGTYTMPLPQFALFALFIVALLSLLIYYVKKHAPKTKG